jgi:hypothetical protein
MDIHERPEEERLRRAAVMVLESFPEVVDQDLHVVS